MIAIETRPEPFRHGRLYTASHNALRRNSDLATRDYLEVCLHGGRSAMQREVTPLLATYNDSLTYGIA